MIFFLFSHENKDKKKNSAKKYKSRCLQREYPPHTLYFSRRRGPHLLLACFSCLVYSFQLFLIFPSLIPPAWSWTWLWIVRSGTLSFQLFHPWKTFFALYMRIVQRDQEMFRHVSSGILTLNLDVSVTLCWLTAHIPVAYKSFSSIFSVCFLKTKRKKYRMSV